MPDIIDTIQTKRLQWYGHVRRMPEERILTPWCRVLPEQLTGLQLVKKFPAFHGTRRFITTLTSVRHLSLSWASPIQSTCPHRTSWRSILILSTHLRLGLPSGPFARGENTKINYGLDTAGEKEKRTSRKTWMEAVQAAMTAGNLGSEQWRNREEWRLVSGIRKQLLKTNRTDR